MEIRFLLNRTLCVDHNFQLLEVSVPKPARDYNGYPVVEDLGDTGASFGCVNCGFRVDTQGAGEYKQVSVAVEEAIFGSRKFDSNEKV